MVFAGIPTTNIATNNNRNNTLVSGQYIFRKKAAPNVNQIDSKSETSSINQNINLSHPGLGMKNKFDMISTTNLLKTFNNQHPQENYSKNDHMAAIEPDNSMMQLASDPIEDYVTIFPHDANISELRNNNSNSYDLISSRLEKLDNLYDENNNARKDDDFKELDLAHIDRILNEDDSENERMANRHGKPLNDKKYNVDENNGFGGSCDGVDNGDIETVGERDGGEVVDDDEEDDDEDETENELLSLELGKVSLYLQDPNTHMKPADSEISINNSTNQGNYDLIDEINYALDDEYQIKHINLYSWDGHS